MSLRLADLAAMTQPQSNEALRTLVRDAKAPRNGQAKGVDARIHELEVRHGMTTSEMLAKYERGEVPDTADTARWLVLASGR